MKDALSQGSRETDVSIAQTEDGNTVVTSSDNIKV
jgi:hypothetical protein